MPNQDVPELELVVTGIILHPSDDPEQNAATTLGLTPEELMASLIDELKHGGVPVQLTHGGVKHIPRR